MGLDYTIHPDRDSGFHMSADEAGLSEEVRAKLGRWSQWSSFGRDTCDVYPSDSGLDALLPSCEWEPVPITPGYLERVREARERWRPGILASGEPEPLHRFTPEFFCWLLAWGEWALEHLDDPVLTFS